jgi:copper homeostasis protein
MGKVLIEVAVSTTDDARVAHAEGADRLELSSALELGGLTPSVGTILEVTEATPLPVVVMVRPRAGGFVYSAAEFATMLRDVDVALARL